MNKKQTQFLSGWGRYPTLSCNVYQPLNESECRRIISSDSNSFIARGAGRAYGDAAISQTSDIVICDRLTKCSSFNSRNGILRCEAGVTIGQIIETYLPKGWFPPVVPGTKHVTVGGAIAADIHGKNHHRDGSFCRFVKSMSLTLADGQTITCSPEYNADLFYATAGGMGLTGIITEAELQLIPVKSPLISTKKIVCQDLASLCTSLETAEKDYQYSVAWLDCLSEQGRGIVILGNHTQVEFPNTKFFTPLSVPDIVPSGLINGLTIGLFNEAYYQKAISEKKESMAGYNQFFFPLDVLNNWNRLYGKSGFTQYQCVLPSENALPTMQAMLKHLRQNNSAPALAVLKRFGAQNNDAPLSFPMPGYTLALDIAVHPALQAVLAEMDQMVIAEGGRVYLAKDAFLTPESFRAMYKHFPEWLAIKNKYDPQNKFSSALSQRLRMNKL
ncbi:MAG: FAD-binding oxidoreductase [Candidatus Obscuribacterales bacterium]|nr:FAD-binding oxidoreductase [Candidatus Obscuribacterales bacterium]